MQMWWPQAPADLGHRLGLRPLDRLKCQEDGKGQMAEVGPESPEDTPLVPLGSVVSKTEVLPWAPVKLMHSARHIVAWSIAQL